MSLIHLSSSLRQALASSRVMYHGTAMGKANKLYNSIVTNGLIDPKKQCMKRESCKGVHLTNSIVHALKYSAYAENAFKGNQLVVVVRADVAAETVAPDNDLGKNAADLNNAIETMLEEINDYWKRTINNSPKEALFRFSDNPSGMSKQVAVKAKVTVEDFLEDELSDVGITDYSKPFYHATLEYLTTLAKAMALGAVIDALLKFISVKDLETYDNHTLARDLLNGLVAANPDLFKCRVVSKNTYAEDLNMNKDLKAKIICFYPAFSPYVAKEIPAFVYRLFLISPGFKSSSDDDAGFSVSYLDSIGYEGRTRIIGLVELLRWYNLDLPAIVENCRQRFGGRSINPDMLKLPIARIHYGTGSKFVRDVLVTATTSSRVGTDYVIRSLLNESNIIPAVDRNGYAYGNVLADVACRYA